MIYEKGTFNTIPNKEHLRGKPSELQAIYFWIVDHADSRGICFPKRQTIADEAGCGIKSVDKYIKVLVEDGFLKKTTRRSDGDVKQASNLYQVLIMQSSKKDIDIDVQGVEKGAKQGSEKGAVTKPILIKPNIVVPKETTEEKKQRKLKEREEAIKNYSFKVELEKLRDSYAKFHKIIYNYFLMKGYQYDNLIQFEKEVSRNIKPARALEGYTSSQINKTMQFCKDTFDIWALETVVKRIADTVNIKQ